MFCVALDSKADSEYDDTSTSYEFPSRYLKIFEPLSHGEPVLAVIYEPGPGRRRYVGYARISQPPRLTGTRSNSGQRKWAVDYVDGYQPFPRPVPALNGGVPLEAWLTAIRPDQRGIASRGNAVRRIEIEDAERIVAIALGEERAGELVYPLPTDVLDPPELARERVERLTRTLERDARFRATVLEAYDWRCAVTGFSAYGVRRARVSALLDAAHVKPVALNGSDHVPNGLALTPTLHRLFDQGLFTIEYRDLSLRTVVSPRLEPSMVRSHDDSFRLPLVTGMIVRPPSSRDMWPDPMVLRFHNRTVFKTN
jgi:putative restriction endonuclease